MNILFDAVVLLVLLFFVWRGASRGFVLTLCGLLAVVVALVGASFLSNVLAEPVANWVEPVVEKQIHAVLDESVKNPESTPDSGEIPEASDSDTITLSVLVDQLKENKLFAGFADAFQKAVDEGTAQVVSSAAKSVAHYAAVQIAHSILFTVSFALLLLLWFLLSRALNLVAKLPGLRSLNKLGGGAVGLLKGCVILFILAWLVRMSGLQLPDATEKTYLVRFFLNTNPVSLLLGA